MPASTPSLTVRACLRDLARARAHCHDITASVVAPAEIMRAFALLPLLLSAVFAEEKETKVRAHLQTTAYSCVSLLRARMGLRIISFRLDLLAAQIDTVVGIDLGTTCACSSDPAPARRIKPMNFVRNRVAGASYRHPSCMGVCHLQFVLDAFGITPRGLPDPSVPNLI